jgi:trehalose synthase
MRTEAPPRTVRGDLIDWARGHLPDRELVVVSNREPYSHVRDETGIRWVRNAGGLTVALDAVMQALGGEWVAHGAGNAHRDVVDDDREGEAVLAKVREKTGARSDLSVPLLPPRSHRVINAPQGRSAVVVQESLSEGFALTVSGALWKRRGVVASAVGGIQLQNVHERASLVGHSVEGCPYQVTRLLRSVSLRRRLGRGGREHVRDNFLHPRELRDYLTNFAHLVAGGGRR